jgi:ArsR family transcriptional regulator
MTAKGTTKRVQPRDEECDPAGHPHGRKSVTLATEDALERAASLLRALGDPSRLRLLERLAEDEWCVSELAEVAGTGLSTISQQLRLLRAERVVKRRRSGKHIYYSLVDLHVKALIQNALHHGAERNTPNEGDDHD